MFRFQYPQVLDIYIDTVTKVTEMHQKEKGLSLSVFNVKRGDVKHFAHQKGKTTTRTNATQHEASSTAKARSHVFLFHIFLSFLAKLQDVAYIGMLPGLSCFKLNSWASTPPPLLATMSQTLISLMEEGGVGGAQCATTVGSNKVQKKKKKMWQLQSYSRCADSGFWEDSSHVKEVLQDSLYLIKEC